MIVCKSPAEIERMRAANVLVADVLAELAAMAAPGRDDCRPRREGGGAGAGRRAQSRRSRAIAAIRRSLCASVNEQVVHGIPSNAAAGRGGHHLARHGREAERVLRGFGRDRACRHALAPDVLRLLRVTQESLEKGIAQVRVGARVSDIGHAIQKHVEAEDFRSSASSSGTGLARRCTRIRRSPTTASLVTGRGWPRGWCSRSSRW